MKRLCELFDVRYGHSLELNRMKLAGPEKGIAFVSRKNRNNGISAFVEPIEGETPGSPGELTVALGGEGGALSTFLQERLFYTGRDVAVLTSKEKLSKTVLLFYCGCIKANSYKYGFGRQANRTLKDILLPERMEIPEWVESVDVNALQGAEASAIASPTPELIPGKWGSFEYQNLFDIESGRGPRLKDLSGTGTTPVITSTDSNNGRTGFTEAKPRHRGNTISVNRDGSVGEAFYQEVGFCSSEAVHVFVPKFKMNPYIALFLTTLIRLEKFRYTYGRKWGIERMKKTLVRLPVLSDGTPDWDFMERYIKSLPFSSQI